MLTLKHGKLTALSLALLFAIGCTSKGGDTAGNETLDPNAGLAGQGAGYGSEFDSNYGSGQSESEAALRAIKTFYFEFDSSDLKQDAMRALDVHASDLQSSGKRVVLEGHTDERGTREYNMALGERRAKAVQRYLVLQGVSPAQLELVSYGEERPVAGGHSEADWAQNRRVELRD